MCKDFLRPGVPGLQCWAPEPASCRLAGAQHDRTERRKCELCSSVVQSSATSHRILGQSCWRRAFPDSNIVRVFDGDKGCSGGNRSEQFCAVRSSSLTSLKRGWSRSEFSGLRSESRLLSQHSESKTSSTANGKDARISINGTSWNVKLVSALLRSKGSLLQKWRIAVRLAWRIHGRSEHTMWGQAWLVHFPGASLTCSSTVGPWRDEAKGILQIGPGNR